MSSGIVGKAFQQWRRRRRARSAALRRFHQMSGQSAIGSMTRVLAAEPGELVVRVCAAGDRIPPLRYWYRVADDGTVTDLGPQEAARFEKGPWR